MTTDKRTPQQAKEDRPVVLRWNIDDDFYKDGIILYKDGSLAINCGGHVWVQSLRNWFRMGDENDRSQEVIAELVAAVKEVRVEHDLITSFKRDEMGGSYPSERHDEADCRACRLQKALAKATALQEKGGK